MCPRIGGTPVKFDEELLKEKLFAYKEWYICNVSLKTMMLKNQKGKDKLHFVFVDQQKNMMIYRGTVVLYK